MPPITKTCRYTNQEFSITDFEQEFCKKMDVPLPTINKTERTRKFTAFGNTFCLYKGKCSKTGDEIVQTFRPDCPFPVYRTDFWWSDKWDQLEFGIDYDFSKPFFRQYKNFCNKTPKSAMSVTYSTLINCDYINGCNACKNCYLIFEAANDEDCYFSYNIWYSKDCVDCSFIHNCELCYECISSKNLYNVRYAFNSLQCKDSAFLWNCTSCEDCFGCSNLRHKKYCFLNQQLSKEEYKKRISNIQWDNWDVMNDWWNKFLKFAQTTPQPAVRGLQLENSTGDFIHNCRNANNCFQSSELQDCSNTTLVFKANDCMDYFSWGDNCELVYCTAGVGFNSQNIKFCYVVYNNASDLEFCFWCINCQNCFACSSLTNKQYCIFNKQYTKDEYFELKSRILSQSKDTIINFGNEAYGEYFPYDLSTVTYNDSDANAWFPLSKEEALKRGANWMDDMDKKGKGSIDFVNLPKNTSQVTDSILNETLSCIQTSKLYKIISKEWKVYRERNLPIPREHWMTRLQRRHFLLNTPMLYDRTCAKSGKPIKTTFLPDSPWIVYSNEEYTKEFSS